jgi:hypothetical protein
MLSEGKTRDDILDAIKMRGQSEEMPREARQALERMIGLTGRKGLKEEITDTYDNILEVQGEGQANDYMLEMARQSGQAEGVKVGSKERTIELFGEIQNLLEDYEKSGGDTGILKGSYEKVLNRLGRTQDPKLVDIASKISTSLIAYRRDNTGTAYSDQEGREYKAIFPDISSVNLANMAKINSLVDTFNGDIDHFYSRKLGDFYDKNIKDVTQTEEQVQKQEGQQGQETQARYKKYGLNV